MESCSSSHIQHTILRQPERRHNVDMAAVEPKGSPEVCVGQNEHDVSDLLDF